MKRIVPFFLSVCLLLSLLAGCGGQSKPVPDGEKLKIVTTVFPEYDWVLHILGDRAEGAEVAMLLDSGVDLHSYQPTADDMITISSCDVFIYVGGESDAWVEAALQEAVNPNMVAINLLEALGDAAKEEEIVEGMEDEHDHDEEHDHDGEVEYDEHVWLSLRCASVLCERIADALGQADSANADTYAANAAAYVGKLAELDAAYQTAVDAAAVKTLLFGDRFPFRYLADDYGLSYYAAFAGCSAETEASFETVVFLANKVDELGLKAILQIESSDGAIARTIRENTRSGDQALLTLDSMQSVTAADVADGVTYLSIMEKNLSVLRDALR